MLSSFPAFDADFLRQFDTLLRWRRDVRHFDTRAIAAEDMAALLDAASLAPSVGNAQPWRFVRLRTPTLREAVAAHVDAENARAAAGYAEQESRDAYRALKLHGLREAPELLAVFCDERPAAGHRLGVATMPEMLRYSCVTAIHTLWLAARARGIGLGWVSILDPDAVTVLLDAPSDWTLIALLCLGYPEAPSDIPELERRGWQSREPLVDRLFER
ncbi:5,6-dimethylbenzimidazole synthase [uncultured Sphingomonas sp.]|uniref:5,6-dimethylbenzimidazole synthase n=1 Tax=uncultured Sphingomonas sp. TaxID=158754 RepID=UPI0025F0000F|nr:5,6-dimethylbenzimidazole synthase [uncultured Sphingomonas sp.]